MRTQIVVAGGGAGGLELVRQLGTYLGRDQCDIILLEPQQTHVWTPLLHEVAAGSLDANLDETGYREHAHRWHYRFFQGRLENIDRDRREVIVAPILDEDGSELIGRQHIRYDYLVIAIGSVTNSYGTPGADRNCIFLDDRAAADRFRLKLLNQCLRVSRQMSADPASDAQVRVAIVGGGATGVELAAELYNAAAALKHYGLETFDESRLAITLLEAGKRILPALPDKLAAAVTTELQALGVRVLTGARVAQVVGTTVVFAGGGSFDADLKVWAAGVKAPDFLKDIGGLETNAANQLVGGPTLQAARAPRSIRRIVAGREAVPFTYRDYGSLVSLSRYSTVGSLMGGLIGGKLAIEGRLARLVYVSLYQMRLLAIHGWLRGVAMLLIGRVNNVIRPRLKLH